MHAKGSRQIEKLSSCYREKAQKSRWIEDLLRIYRADREFRNFPRWVKKLSSLIKSSFSKKGKKHRNECNQANYSTKDPINMLSSQKASLNKKKMQIIHEPKHTHTYTKQI